MKRKPRRDRDGVGRETGYCVDCGRDITKRRDDSLMCEFCEARKYSGWLEHKMSIDDGQKRVRRIDYDE